MQFRNKHAIDRLKAGLQIITPSIAVGVFAGSMGALLLPSLVAITSRVRANIAAFPGTKLGQSIDPWVKAIVAPNHLIWIALACVIAFLYLVRQPVSLFIKRFWAWSIYEGTVLSAACAFAAWRSPFWLTVTDIGAGIFLICVIA